MRRSSEIDHWIEPRLPPLLFSRSSYTHRNLPRMPMSRRNHRHSNGSNPSFESLQVGCRNERRDRLISSSIVSALSSSARINRVVQVKTTSVAFGSSTPTNRTPTTIVKTPGPTAVPAKSNGSVVQKIITPKSKYNLRTRIFNNPPANVNEKEEVTRFQVKSQVKKPLRTRK